MRIGDSRSLTEEASVRALIVAAGAGTPPASAWAPGRCTLVGEHVDYAGGFVLCTAIDLGIAAAVRPSASGRYLVTSDGTTVERADPGPAGDIGDRALAPAIALRSRGLTVPVIEVGIASDLPAGAGLASSAALIVATAVAILRLTGGSMAARDLAAVALSAERDVVGVPCGPLDQRAVIDAPDRGALLLDSLTGATATLPWPWDDALLVGCDTGVHHDVGGAEYRQRRDETALGMAAAGASSCQQLTAQMIDETPVEPAVKRRLRHVMDESRRAAEAADAMRHGDLVGLGRLMSESHRSLRDLHEVSTPALDAVVVAAESVPGCAGARMVGAGFGGTVAALVAVGAVTGCREAMSVASGGGRTFEFRPSPGVAALAPDVVRG